jgi:hypothetical protein
MPMLLQSAPMGNIRRWDGHKSSSKVTISISTEAGSGPPVFISCTQSEISMSEQTEQGLYLMLDWTLE